MEGRTPSQPSGVRPVSRDRSSSAKVPSPIVSPKASRASAVPPSSAALSSTDEHMRYSRSAYGSAARASAAPSGKQRLWRIVFVAAIVVLIASLSALGAIVYQYWAQQSAYDGLTGYAQVSEDENLALSDLTVDWSSLRAINPDIVAWIYVPGTEVNYPVVQGDDNEEYLHKAFDGSTGWLASAGTIFLDSSNDPGFSDRNSALYGHHMNDGSMFATFADFVDQDLFDSHRDIYVLTPNGNYRLKTFALVKTTGSDAIVETSFADDQAYRSYLQDKIDRSVVSQSGDVLGPMDIKQSMFFSTCEYSQADGRAVLFASVVETTVSGDPYLDADENATTTLSQDENKQMDSNLKEVA